MKRFLYSALFTVLLLTGCRDELERFPLDKPSDQTFFSNETELLMALNACYKQLTPLDREVFMNIPIDHLTDIGFQREATQDKAIANGNIDPQNSYVLKAWNDHYTTISKCNNLLGYMDRAKGKVQPAIYERIAAEARFIRSLNYGMLTQLFGDVPLVSTVIPETDYLQLTRTSKAQVVKFILNELDQAASVLPLSHSGNNIGRATKGAALALKARIALYNGLYSEAKEAALAVMQAGTYSLYPSYRELFMYKGEGCNEVILDYQYLKGINVHRLPKIMLTRMAAPNGFSIFTPTQDLVDSYECTDGKVISESPLYNPADPFTNRDPRLRQSIMLPRVGSATETVTPGTIWQGYEYKTGREIAGEEYYLVNGKKIPNQDVVNQYASFTGYCWLKYLDPIDSTVPTESELNIILIRYAEVLLTYAEAKIELNEIDSSVLDALNSIRARAYGVDRSQTAKYPAITSQNQATLRNILRRERKVELAMEGFRYDDIRRWQIAEKAMGRAVYGRPKNFTTLTRSQVPRIDANGLLDYSSLKGALRYIETNVYNKTAHNLWPIPQRERDLNPSISQNPGY